MTTCVYVCVCHENRNDHTLQSSFPPRIPVAPPLKLSAALPCFYGNYTIMKNTQNNFSPLFFTVPQSQHSLHCHIPADIFSEHISDLLLSERSEYWAVQQLDTLCVCWILEIIGCNDIITEYYDKIVMIISLGPQHQPRCYLFMLLVKLTDLTGIFHMYFKRIKVSHSHCTFPLSALIRETSVISL